MIRIFATIGFLLALILTYFSFRPLRTADLPEHSLKQILECKENQISNNDSILDQKEIDEILKQSNQTVPTDMLRNLVNNLEKLNKNISAKSEIDINYCNVSSDVNALEKIKSFYNSQKGYSYGSIDELVATINKTPFFKIQTSSLKIPSVFARTNYCGQPINRSNIHFYGVTDLGTTKNIVMLTIKITPETSEFWYQNSLSNLIETGQYLKSKYKCNG